MSDLNEWLAVNVLGKGSAETEYDKFFEAFEFQDFRPRENSDQAKMLLEQFDYWTLEKNTGDYNCSIDAGDQMVESGWQDTEEKAITLAVAKAAGCPKELINDL